MQKKVIRDRQEKITIDTPYGTIESDSGNHFVDIGTVVLPDADLGVFLTAAPKVRARRRHSERAEMWQSPEFQDVLEDLLKRDKLDTERADSPLRPAEGAHVIDTDQMDLAQVVECIVALIGDG